MAPGDEGTRLGRLEFEALYQRLEKPVFNVVYRWLWNTEEARDVTQEAFIKAYRALPSFRGDSAFYTWLYRIAINTAKNALVAAKRRPMDYDLDLQDPDQYERAGRLKDDATPENLLLTEEIRQTVDDAIAALQSIGDELRDQR